MFQALLSRWLASLLFQLDCIFHSGFPIFFWVRPKWSINDMPDQTGKVVVVTGGNSGTGYATCKAFYDRGAKVYMASRSETKAREAIRAIESGHDRGFGNAVIDKPGKRVSEKTGKGQIIFLELDLADLGSVETFITEFMRNEAKIDVLFANAGIMATPKGQFTKQGYSLQFGTNVLAHQRLVSGLLSHLVDDSRVVFLSSAGHAQAPAGGVDYESVVRHAHGGAEYQLNPWVDYGQSKWGDIALAKHLDRLHGPRSGGRMISVSVHPGIVATNLASQLPFTEPLLKWVPWLIPVLTRPSIVGATNQLWVATCSSDEARGLCGEYVVPFQAIGKPRPDLLDAEACRRLWDWCEEQGQKHA